jgi:hypothetical protein
MLQYIGQGTLLELAIVLVFTISVILLCIWSFRKPTYHFQVTRTRPKAEKIDGFGGIKVTDYSYMDGTGRTLPVGFGTTPEREKPETYEHYRSRHDESMKKESES